MRGRDERAVVVKAEVAAAFVVVEAELDPDGLLNPGVLLHSEP